MRSGGRRRVPAVQPCAYVVRLAQRTEFRCPALAVPGSAFCPVHGSRGHKEPAVAIVRGDPDADVLPWTRDDRVIFETAQARQASERARRKVSVRR
jgi:hypothetical protein